MWSQERGLKWSRGKRESCERTHGVQQVGEGAQHSTESEILSLVRGKVLIPGVEFPLLFGLNSITRG